MVRGMVPDPHNPYAAPQDALPMATAVDGMAPLASRGQRLAAAIVDSLVIGGVNVGIALGLGFYEDFPNIQLSYGQTVTLGAIGFVVWFVIQVSFLRQGQTLGKRALSIRMVDFRTGEVPPVTKLVFVRMLPVSVVSMIPIIGGFLSIIDVLFIFGDERRCVHDLIANTKVVEALRS